MAQTDSPHTYGRGGGSRDESVTEHQHGLAPLLPGGEPIESLLRKAQYFVPGTPTADYREVHRVGGRGRRSSIGSGGGMTR
jgi:nitrate reductase alpha subunit